MLIVVGWLKNTTGEAVVFVAEASKTTYCCCCARATFCDERGSIRQLGLHKIQPHSNSVFENMRV